MQTNFKQGYIIIPREACHNYGKEQDKGESSCLRYIQFGLYLYPRWIMSRFGSQVTIAQDDTSTVF